MSENKNVELESDDICDDDANLNCPEVVDLKQNPEAVQPKSEMDFETKYNELLDKYHRQLAEFDNFRKRTTKEKADQYSSGIRAAAEKLLPVVDNFERAFDSCEKREDNFYQGINLIARQFETILTDLGIEKIPAAPGDNFDTHTHYAVAHVEDKNFGPNQVAEILQNGYRHKDKVLRPSMVKVAN